MATLANAGESTGAAPTSAFLVDPRVRALIDLGTLSMGDVTYPLLLSILNLHDFAVVPVDGATLVVPSANVRQQPMPTLPPDGLRCADAEWVTTVLPIRKRDAGGLVATLRPLMPQVANLGTASGSLVITDTCANARRIIGLARELDMAVEPKPGDAQR